MLRTNFLRDRLRAGKPVLGTWLVIPSVVTVDIIASTGVDFVIIDREHGPITFETAQEMAIACESRGVSPVMRVGDIERSFIQNALDVGMHGIQVPNIASRAEAERVIHYAKYPPLGDRGFSPFTRAGGYSIENGARLVQEGNDNTLVILNIEGQDAVSRLDEILEVQSSDVIFVGLFDLSKAVGVPGDVEHPKVQKLLVQIVDQAKARGKHVGTIATSLEKVEQFKAMGMTYIVYLVDCDVLRSAYSSAVRVFHSPHN